MAPKDEASNAATALENSGEYPAGVDVSHWQGAMDWARCVAAGIKFAFIRSTIGSSGMDNRFLENWLGAEAAGLLRGAYHLYRPDRDAVAQAEHFVASAATQGELPPVVDLETVPGVAVPPSYPEEVRRFLELVVAGTGRKAIIYTNPAFWRTALGAPAWGGEHDLWQAQWTSANQPDEMAPWDGWTFWQWTNEALGADYGASSTYIDLNRFNGDEAALYAYADASLPTLPEEKRVRLTDDANVRSEARISAETLIGGGTTSAGREFTLLGFVPGQDVGGNDQWAQVVALVHSSLVEVVEDLPPVPGDGFDSPVGTAAERASPQIWPGKWIDANPYLNLYEIRPGVFHYHTGADLNLNYPSWDADRFKPVYAIADGEVVHARDLGGSWGNVVVVRHDLNDGRRVYSRYAHLDTMTVLPGNTLARGEQLGTIGRPPPDGAYHLHFDISTSDVLEGDPGHWPGSDAQAVIDNYTDPRQFIIDSRRPLPPVPPLPPDRIDLLPFFTGNLTGKSVPFEMQTSWGPQERVQLQVEGDTFYYVKGNPAAANWEERWFDPNEQMIYFGTDTSESGERYYTQRTGQQYGAPWCPRRLEVGEVVGPFTPQVTHYRKKDCVTAESGASVDYRKLLAVHASYTFPSSITLDGVIELAWLKDPSGPWLEKYWYSRDQRAPGLVGWQSSDGRRSWVSELHNPGSRPDSKRLQIPCLQRT